MDCHLLNEKDVKVNSLLTIEKCASATGISGILKNKYSKL